MTQTYHSYPKLWTSLFKYLQMCLKFCWICSKHITKTRLFKYIENFTTKKTEKKKSDKNSDILHISDQNTDCGYSLEPPCRGGSNEYTQSMFWAEIRKIMYTPCKLQFYYIKVGFKGVKII